MVLSIVLFDAVHLLHCAKKCNCNNWQKLSKTKSHKTHLRYSKALVNQIGPVFHQLAKQQNNNKTNRQATNGRGKSNNGGDRRGGYRVLKEGERGGCCTPSVGMVRVAVVQLFSMHPIEAAKEMRWRRSLRSWHFDLQLCDRVLWWK